MQISTETFEYFISTAKTAQMLNIEDIVITNNQVRGIDANKTLFILENNITLTDDVSSFGSSRLGELVGRFNVMKMSEDETDKKNETIYNILVDDANNEKYIKSIEMKSGKNKCTYKCGLPSFIKAPKEINDLPHYKIDFGAKTYKLINTASKVYDDEIIEISHDNGIINFQISDLSNDICSISNDIEGLNENFKFKYNLNKFLQVVSNIDDPILHIGQKGLISSVIHGLTVYMMPQG